jgi:type IV pilus modification protein PilV
MSITYSKVCSLPHRQGGFTLIEVLVAMVVLSIGLLGLAGLQVKTLSFNRDAYLLSQVTNLQYDMLDRMRANRGAAGNGEYNINLTEALPTYEPSLTPSGTLAQKDKAVWRNSLASPDLLPQGTRVLICRGLTHSPVGSCEDSAFTCSGSGPFSIVIRYQNSGGLTCPTMTTAL